MLCMCASVCMYLHDAVCRCECVRAHPDTRHAACRIKAAAVLAPAHPPWISCRLTWLSSRLGGRVRQEEGESGGTADAVGNNVSSQSSTEQCSCSFADCCKTLAAVISAALIAEEPHRRAPAPRGASLPGIALPALRPCSTRLVRCLLYEPRVSGH